MCHPMKKSLAPGAKAESLSFPKLKALVERPELEESTCRIDFSAPRNSCFVSRLCSHHIRQRMGRLELKVLWIHGR